LSEIRISISAHLLSAIPHIIENIMQVPLKRHRARQNGYARTLDISQNLRRMQISVGHGTEFQLSRAGRATRSARPAVEQELKPRR
jgi:hypothetical protein